MVMLMATPNKKGLQTEVNQITLETTTLTVSLIQKLEGYITYGLSLPAAAGLAEISYDTLREWLNKGKAFNTGIHGELFRRLAKAAATSETEFFDSIKKSAVGRPAEYLMEPLRNEKNEIVMVDDKPFMTPAKDKDGNPILIRREIMPDYRAAQWHLERRNPKVFGRDTTVNIFFNENPDAALNGNQVIDVDNSAINVEKLPDEIDVKMLEAALKLKKKQAANESKS